METYAKGAGISLEEASKNEFVLNAIAAARAKTRSVDASAPPSRKNASMSVDELRKMKPEEKKEKLSFTSFRDQRRAAARSNS